MRSVELKMHKIHFGDPTWGAYDASQTSLLDGEGDTPSPYLSSRDTFGVSMSATQTVSQMWPS